MGIQGIVQPVLVIQCGHLANPKAFWTTKNDGTEAPDLHYENFPNKGRIVMSNQTFFVSCWNCREGLDVLVREHGTVSL